MSTVHMMLGGQSDTPIQLENHKEYDLIIGVDRGALQLIEAGYQPDLAIGDFDSVSAEEFNLIVENSKQLEKFPSEKDETDTELAVRWLKNHYPKASVKVYGWNGGRVDHLIHLLYLIHQPELKHFIPNFEWISLGNRAKFYLPGEYIIENDPRYTYFSVISMTPVKELEIQQAKYNLETTNLFYPYAWISNEFINDYIKLSFNEGIILFLRTRDVD